MGWTPEQLETLYANAYGNILKCPVCGRELVVERSGAIDTLGSVWCRTCEERHVISTQNDPLRSAFRRYTEKETKQIIAADRARRTPRCPVDGTAMDVNLQRSLGRTSNAVVRCRRCTQSVTYVRLHG
jgi:transcription elongation factor Elf1